MNGLKFDSHIEEKAVELFSKNIIKAGEDFYLNPMDAPFIPTWSRVKSAIPDFLINVLIISIDILDNPFVSSSLDKI